MMQIIEQTHEEKVKMYMKCSKKELIQMLIQSNMLLDRFEPRAPQRPDTIQIPKDLKFATQPRIVGGDL